MYQRIQQQAGFIEFAELRFDDTRELFREGGLDVREVSMVTTWRGPLELVIYLIVCKSSLQ